MREERYRAKFGHRGRGLADLQRSVGNILEDIELRLGRRERVRVSSSAAASARHSSISASDSRIGWSSTV